VAFGASAYAVTRTDTALRPAPRRHTDDSASSLTASPTSEAARGGITISQLDYARLLEPNLATATWSAPSCRQVPSHACGTGFLLLLLRRSRSGLPDARRIDQPRTIMPTEGRRVGIVPLMS
jgi:hypothetical protein